MLGDGAVASKLGVQQLQIILDQNDLKTLLSGGTRTALLYHNYEPLEVIISIQR